MYIKFKKRGQIFGHLFEKMQIEWQTVKTLILEEQSDLGLYCLPRHICPKALDHYGTSQISLYDWSALPFCYIKIFS